MKTPDFENEKKEAAWLDTHQDELLMQFEQAAQNGSLQRGTLARRALATSIRLDSADIKLAKELAEKRGLRYQTYLKMIIHQHLAQEVATASRGRS